MRNGGVKWGSGKASARNTLTRDEGDRKRHVFMRSKAHSCSWIDERILFFRTTSAASFSKKKKGEKKKASEVECKKALMLSEKLEHMAEVAEASSCRKFVLSSPKTSLFFARTVAPCSRSSCSRL